MYSKVYTTLEFNKVLEQVAKRAISSMAKERITALEPYDNLDEVNTALKETDEATQLIMKQGLIPIRGLKDLTPITKRLSVGGSLSMSELLFIADTLRSANQVSSYYKGGLDYIQQLTIHSYFEAIDSIPSLYKSITRCIISEEEMADDASSTLLTIRRDIKSVGGRVKSQLNKIIHSASQSGYLQDNNYTIRNDRYCVPLKAEYKNQLKGMIHDQSSTGSTLFVEPMAIIELNNTLSQLAIQEKKEITKILEELSEEAALYVHVLNENQVQLTHLDFIFAKAGYGIDYKCSYPTFNDDGVIDLTKARHPLLDQDTVVPTTIYLGKDFTTLVITGPNTGGKTVTLKTLGLHSLMGQSGLHIPASDGAKLTLLDNIFADIGDEQSIEQSLSTFSSHMTNITRILEQVTDRSLVLFDELGAGTDPTEGAALAMAILDNLKTYNILTVATTHYSELKVYALSTDGVENASCEFNVDTLRPTYKLLIGIPGKSNAFAISKRLGLSDGIIDEAKNLLSGREVRFEDLITDLETNKKTALLEKERAEQYRKEAEKLRGEVESQRSRLAQQKIRILEEAKTDAARLLADAKSEADQIIRDMNKLASQGSGMNMAELEASRSKLREKVNAANAKASKPVNRKKKLTTDTVHVGDTVMVTSLNSKGTVIKVNKSKKEVTVQMGIMKSTLSFDSIEPIDDTNPYAAPAKKGTARKYTPAKGSGFKGNTAMNKSTSIKPELDLRGQTTAEALEVVDKYLDDAYLAHLPQVTLIHGKGTGALRQGLHQFLRTSPHVNSYRLGEFGEGDSGVTVVTFKE